MNRHEFHKVFRSVGPALLPVIHVLDDDQALHNVALAIEGGAHGVFLINHDFPVEPFVPIIRRVRERYPSLWLGVNFLAVTLSRALPTIGALARDGIAIDGYWADDARIDESRAADDQAEAAETRSLCAQHDWRGLYFGGTAFKKQREVEAADWPRAASIASGWMDVVTTSGVATGQAAQLDKIDVFRDACGESALALASGVTPANAEQYAARVDAFLVATGVNRDDDFYHIDPTKLNELAQICRRYGARHG